jgi:DNA-binding MarR family transcriptional regulator
MHPTLRLKTTYLAMRQRIDESVARFGLTSAQFELLQQLLHEDGLEHRELQRRLSVASPTLTNIIDGMVQVGHVERRQDESDARVRRIWLKPKAVSLCQTEAFKAAGKAFVDRMFHGVAQEDQQRFLAMLETISRNLQPA